MSAIVDMRGKATESAYSNEDRWNVGDHLIFLNPTLGSLTEARSTDCATLHGSARVSRLLYKFGFYYCVVYFRHF